MKRLVEASTIKLKSRCYLNDTASNLPFGHKLSVLSPATTPGPTSSTYKEINIISTLMRKQNS